MICDIIIKSKYSMEVSKMREGFTLRCTVCNEENYIGDKNKRLHPERVEFNKYCPRCNKKTVHKEKK